MKNNTPILFVLLLVSFWGCIQPSTNEKAQLKVTSLLSSLDTAGFKRATSVQKFVWPKDHGKHPGYRTEWWYYTGNLKSKDGKLFGFQFTIFRNEITAVIMNRQSNWAAKEIYMGNFAITDVNANMFYANEIFERGAGGLAGAEMQPTRVWVRDWRMTMGDNTTYPISLRAKANEIKIDLKLDSLKPTVLQGNYGLSQKSSKKGNASYYYSIPRLATKGEIEIANKKYEVVGEAWLDREWSTSALDTNQAGWDWFSLQMDNNTEIMYYQLRNKKGGSDAASQGAWMDAKGIKTEILQNDITLNILNTWKSTDGILYPSGWKMSLPKWDAELEIIPMVKDQELKLTVRYWEGLVKITGTLKGKPVTGKGYVELTGYE